MIHIPVAYVYINAIGKATDSIVDKKICPDIEFS